MTSGSRKSNYEGGSIPNENPHGENSESSGALPGIVCTIPAKSILEPSR